MSDSRIADVAQAKDFLVSKVVEEAQTRGISLSDAERKMMYYSVLERTVADEVADQFPEYDPEYEQKISDLLRSSYGRNDADRSEIKAAIKKLKTGDHYLSIMAGQAISVFGRAEGGQSTTRVKDSFSLLIAGVLAASALMVFVVYWQSWKEAFWHWWSK